MAEENKKQLLSKYRDYVSSETAALLKQAGFDEYCIFRYIFDVFVECDSGQRVWWYKNSDLDDEVCSACSYQDALKWLREQHNLCVYVFPTSSSLKEKYGDWEAGICYCDSGIDATINASGHIFGKDYNECTENAILYCIVNLLKHEVDYSKTKILVGRT